MLYHVHNMSRALSTRAKRYTSPTHRGMVQFMAGQRIIRGRPLVIDENTLLKNLDSLKSSETAGYIEVRTPDGRRVDLETLEPAAPPPAVPLPIIVPDSMNNDVPTGRPMPIYPDGAVQSSKPTPQESPVAVEEIVEPTPVAPTAPEQPSESTDVEYQEEGGGAPRKFGKGKRR